MKRDLLSVVYWLTSLTVAGVAIGIVIIALAACSTVESVEPSSDTSACERAAAERGEQCGTVYEFAASCANEIGHIEICVLDADLEAAELKYGPSKWTTRNDFRELVALHVPPPCFWPGPGCNALSNCYGHERCNP